MQKLFEEVGSLDRRCYQTYHLSEDVLMEHAANAMAEQIAKNFPKGARVLAVCSGGNNGADAMACARILQGDYNVKILYAKPPKSSMALLQAQRAEALGVPTCQELEPCDVLIDALVGTGFSGEFPLEMQTLLQKMNTLDAFKIACDIPSGLRQNGTHAKEVFKADLTITMGALKRALFSDAAKEVVGEITVANLGVSRAAYEGESNRYLLDMEDMRLPFRKAKNTHKGSFGHLALALGEKSGASILSAKAALRFGAGLVSLVGYEQKEIPHTIMYSHELPKNATALALGMGLGNEFSDEEIETFLDNDLPLVADADIFGMTRVLDLLKRKNIVLTPHPKEFTSLLRQTQLADVSVEELQNDRFAYAELFSKNYPDAVLLLKGANVIIAGEGQVYVNPYGKSSLAKGGSGDVLSGMIGALLAQGYTPLQAALNASLAHAKLAQNYRGADFSLTPEELIEGLKEL
jgi:hydroxyethylthiazole kinase-like uncharacterized protein yjeF